MKASEAEYVAFRVKEGVSDAQARQEFRSACGADMRMGQAEFLAIRGIADDNCEDCVDVITEYKTVTVPCARNKYVTEPYQTTRTYTVKVPKVVNWTDYEKRTKKVPVTIYKDETRHRMENQNYTISVPETYVDYETVTKTVPKTVYVNVTEKVPRNKVRMVPQTRTRSVK